MTGQHLLVGVKVFYERTQVGDRLLAHAKTTKPLISFRQSWLQLMCRKPHNQCLPLQTFQTKEMSKDIRDKIQAIRTSAKTWWEDHNRWSDLSSEMEEIIKWLSVTFDWELHERSYLMGVRMSMKELRNQSENYMWSLMIRKLLGPWTLLCYGEKAWTLAVPPCSRRPMN